MKNINKIMVTLSIIFLLGCYSCDDDLQFEPYGGINSSSFWKTTQDVNTAVDGLYLWTAREGIDGRGFIWFENCSDNLVTGRPQSEAARIKNFQMTPANGRDARDNYTIMYKVIVAANQIIKNVPGMEVPQESKNYGLGNAYFFRGFAYMWLAPWYGDNASNGGLPILTEDTPVDKLDQPRAKSVLDNYDMIIDDMRKAADLLPLFSQQDENQWGRPHRAAAWGYMARAALYAAQYDSKYYDIVIEACDKIINLGGADKRSLYPDYGSLFSIANNFSSEYIFSMTGSQLDGPKFAGMSFQNGGWGIYNTWGYFQPTLELYNAYEPGDLRRDATILYPNQHIQFIGRDIHFGVNPPDISSTSGMTFRKWMSPFAPADCLGNTVNPSGNNQSTQMALPLIRFADILLMKAEALIWSKGEGNAEAANLINQVRKRAGLPEDSQATKEQLMNERRCELAFEFQPSRHIDLVRWGIAQREYAKPLHGVKTVLNADGSFSHTETIEIWSSRQFNPQINQVFPLPEKVINTSSVLKQNIGY